MKKTKSNALLVTETIQDVEDLIENGESLDEIITSLKELRKEVLRNETIILFENYFNGVKLVDRKKLVKLVEDNNYCGLIYEMKFDEKVTAFLNSNIAFIEDINQIIYEEFVNEEEETNE